uniref:Uncharacterized protein n=1 Tax=Anguilla anguilla TaxID=7936 RepID=A0A0E9SYH3_ANGAN
MITENHLSYIRNCYVLKCQIMMLPKA